jgi:hypothetical protein
MIKGIEGGFIVNSKLKIGIAWALTVGLASIVACGGQEAPSSVDQDFYDDVMYSSEANALNAPQTNCVRSHRHWLRFNKYAALAQDQILWPKPANTIDSEDRAICGRSLHSILSGQWDGTAWHALAMGFVPAYLNMKAGAALGPTVSAAFNETFSVLISCNVRDVSRAHYLKNTMMDWSAGNTNLPACQ